MVTAGVRLSTVTPSPVGEKRTATLSASSTRRVVMALSTLVGFGATDAAVIAGRVGAVTPEASSSRQAASNDVASSAAGQRCIRSFMVATSVGYADPR